MQPWQYYLVVKWHSHTFSTPTNLTFMTVLWSDRRCMDAALLPTMQMLCKRQCKYYVLLRHFKGYKYITRCATTESIARELTRSVLRRWRIKKLLESVRFLKIKAAEFPPTLIEGPDQSGAGTGGRGEGGGRAGSLFFRSKAFVCGFTSRSTNYYLLRETRNILYGHSWFEIRIPTLNF